MRPSLVAAAADSNGAVVVARGSIGGEIPSRVSLDLSAPLAHVHAVHGPERRVPDDPVQGEGVEVHAVLLLEGCPGLRTEAAIHGQDADVGLNPAHDEFEVAVELVVVRVQLGKDPRQRADGLEGQFEQVHCPAVRPLLEVRREDTESGPLGLGGHWGDSCFG